MYASQGPPPPANSTRNGPRPLNPGGPLPLPLPSRVHAWWRRWCWRWWRRWRVRCGHLQVDEHNMTRLRMNADMADSSQLVKHLIIKVGGGRGAGAGGGGAA